MRVFARAVLTLALVFALALPAIGPMMEPNGEPAIGPMMEPHEPRDINLAVGPLLEPHGNQLAVGPMMEPHGLNLA